jgi:chromosome segregation protein
LVAFSKIRLSGFKSFVDATELVIQPGLTGIVGPNGCGKSNVVEALRWVMGETSAKQLRGGEMNEVIFGGTRDRPARNIAEVSVLLDNPTRNASAQFNDSDEIEVTRRIERDKGSLYRVNGRDVRAKDVQLLFADVATGARSTAIVSQGRIGSIINAKPAQRRNLLEEAAGITGLHNRRHEAELRLQAAENNLARLNDVIVALEAQLEGLKKQARQASRYRTISDSIRSAEALVLLIKREEATAHLDSARAALKAAEDVVAERTGKTSAAATVQADAAAAMPELRKAEAEAAAKYQHFVIAREKLDEELERVTRAREAAEMRLAQIRDDLERESARLGDASEALDRIEEERSRLNAESAAEAGDRDSARETLMSAAKSVEAVEEQLTRMNKQAADGDTSRAAARQQLSEGDLRRQRAERRLDEAIQQLKIVRQNALSPETVAAEEKRTSEADAALNAARAGWENCENQRSRAQNAYEAAREDAQTKAADHTKVHAEAAALEELLADSKTEGSWRPIIDSVAVDSGFEAALGAALGDDLSAASDDTSPMRWADLPPFAQHTPLPGDARPLSEVVRAPERLARRLAQIGIVASSEAAASLIPQLKPGQRLVTQTGDLWRWDGFVALAGAPTAAATRLRQRNRLKDLRDSLESSAATLKAAEGAVEDAKSAVANAQRAEQDARAKVRAEQDENNAARETLAELRQKMAALQGRVASIEDSRAQLQTEYDEAQTQIDTARARLTELGDGAALREEVESKQGGLTALRQDLMDARAVYDSLARQAEDRAQRIAALESEAESWTARKEEAARQQNELQQRQTTAEGEIAALASRPDEITAQRGALMTELNKAEDERRVATNALATGESKLAEADKALRDAEHALSGAREERVRRESVVAQGTQSLQVIEENIRERISCEPGEVRSYTKLKDGEDPPTLEQAEKRLQRLLSERDNLGAVNLRAEQESEELREQIDGLTSERDDLVGAIDRLRQGINKLNREARERLLKSFREVNAHFSNLFAKLFGGGRAHLALTEADDPLEAGLEIMASPPGKRLGNLALLSGGEQALTAVALLFSVFMTNPAPICILDEVDAPLDDANVDRFCNLLAEIIKQTETRVLVVTHHRMTMARMDRLFGVTMGERGVSRLVSVDLKAAEEMRDVA